MKRHIYNIIKIVLLVAVIVVAVVANVSHKNTVVKDMEVIVHYADNDTLVTADELHSAILEQYHGITTLSVKEVNLAKVRDIACQNPFVEKATVFLPVNAKILVKVEQRTPMVRVYTPNNQFYLDTKGRYMPISKIGNQRVIIANGNIKKDFTGKTADIDIEKMTSENPKAENYDIVKVYRLAKYIFSNPKAQSLFDQIYINSDGDLEIIPKLGGHTVVIGGTDRLEEKFENLFALYSKGLSKVGWDKYSAINLKYKDQIICTKIKQ